MNIPVTGTIGILKASVSDEHLDLDQADRILSKMIDAGFYSPLRSLADIFWAVNKTVYLVFSFDYVKLIEKI